MRNSYEISEDGTFYRIYFIDGSFFLIDVADFDAVSKRTWFHGKRGYPLSHTSRKDPTGHRAEVLHKYLLRPPEGVDVDHISGDKMDNRRDNLRLCSHQQNMCNQNKRCTNSSGYTGVSFLKCARKYEAYVHVHGKKHHLGLFESAEDAARARDDAAIVLHGQYARLNFPERCEGA